MDKILDRKNGVLSS